VGDFAPSAFGSKFRPGIRPADLALPAAQVHPPTSRSRK